MKSRTCKVCGAESLRSIRRPFEFGVGAPIRLEDVAMTQCDACGETFLDADQSEQLSAAIRAVRQAGLAATTLASR